MKNGALPTAQILLKTSQRGSPIKCARIRSGASLRQKKESPNIAETACASTVP